MPTPPPSAPRTRTNLPPLHGYHQRTDDYAWLRDDDWQQVIRDPTSLRPDILDWLEAENDYTEAVLAPAKALRTRLADEMDARSVYDDVDPLDADDEWEYYVRHRREGGYPVICRRPAATIASHAPDSTPRGEQILLDGDAQARGKSYYHLGNHAHSRNHRWFAWAVDENGSEVFTLRVKDLKTGQLLDDTIEQHSDEEIAWAADHETLFYTVLDDHHRSCKVLRHRLGTDPKNDTIVYEEPDPGFFLKVATTESHRFLILDAHNHVTNEVRLIDATRPASAPILVTKRDPGTEYIVSHHADRLIILTNADGAGDFKIVETPVASPGREHWVDLVPHRPGISIDTFRVYTRWLVRLEYHDTLPRIVVHEFANGKEHTIALKNEEEAYDLKLDSEQRPDSDTLRFTYSSMATPEHVYDYDMRKRRTRRRKVRRVPGGHDPHDYVTRRILATSHDGAQVPISLLHHRETAIDGSAPLLLYGYGAYGDPATASFDSDVLSLVDRGFVYAIAHVRGGNERGHAWYTDGRLHRKTNTFHDFIAAAHALVEHGFTRHGRIAAHGASAGGMLVGACANMAPELFHAIIAEVPFVDVLNTICDDTLPLTPYEWPEWGNPLESKAAYDHIAAYSPYDNVRAQDYPHIIATAGLTDPVVPYWEPAKWVAKLRATKTNDRLLVLHTDMERGHAGAARSLVYAFLLHVFGIETDARRSRHHTARSWKAIARSWRDRSNERRHDRAAWRHPIYRHPRWKRRHDAVQDMRKQGPTTAPRSHRRNRQHARHHRR